MLGAYFNTPLRKDTLCGIL